MKLGRRLQQLSDHVSRPYTHIWDCCCDHGLLGMDLLQRKMADTVHFVDIVPSLMAQVETQLHLHFPGESSNWCIYCMDVAHAPFVLDSQHDLDILIIIAGVGGDLMVELLKAISAKYPDIACEFLLCPVHHQNKVRQTLIDLEFGLLAETLVEENGRYYEILHVTKSAYQPLSLIGSQMWDLSRQQDQNYLAKVVQHYQRKALRSELEQRALEAYLALKQTAEKQESQSRSSANLLV